jgi:hypothetical protein
MDEPTPRRSVVRGAAWATPVVVAAVAAPWAAASPCPTFTVAAQFVSSTTDRILITNTAPVIIPAGVAITWTVENRFNGANTLDLQAFNGVTLTSGPDPFTFPSLGTQQTYTFVTSTALPQNSSVNWVYRWSRFFYETTILLNFSGAAPLNGCPNQTFCASMNNVTPGSVCA